MKLKLLFLLLLGLFSMAAKAQDYLTVSDSTVLTNQDTQITYLNTLSQGTKSLWVYSVHVVTDSLSGANAGTVYLQTTNDGYTWLNHATSLTVDGTAQQTQAWEGTLYARRARVYAITPSGTRTVNYRMKATLKRIQGP